MIRKRLLDLALVALSAVVWVPVLLVASLAVLITEGRPVYYRSNRRVSVDHVMKVVKFRTMVRNADKIVNRDTVPVEAQVRFLNIPPDSPLYTRVGRFLEGVGLTEIPQLVHVISGRMSLIGNRPLPENVQNMLREEFPHADDRFLTPSGLTGPAQLVGRQALTDDERLTIETAYCRAAMRGYSIRLDLAILFSTVFIVLHVKKPMNYLEVEAIINRYSRVRTMVLETSPEPSPAAVAVDLPQEQVG
ncbi:sugar transferase [Aeromicrobium sp. Leaf350]|uniref:sugar transferase n=1 Tax=Aeromicrobium sp. Leaf350 TaxID=2876565 RepID=UPI001E34045D|nr:sugar transferase [Aeromicrobium sp. Leaf350]